MCLVLRKLRRLDKHQRTNKKYANPMNSLGKCADVRHQVIDELTAELTAQKKVRSHTPI